MNDCLFVFLYTRSWIKLLAAQYENIDIRVMIKGHDLYHHHLSSVVKILFVSFSLFDQIPIPSPPADLSAAEWRPRWPCPPLCPAPSRPPLLRRRPLRPTWQPNSETAGKAHPPLRPSSPTWGGPPCAASASVLSVASTTAPEGSAARTRPAGCRSETPQRGGEPGRSVRWRWWRWS